MPLMSESVAQAAPPRLLRSLACAVALLAASPGAIAAPEPEQSEPSRLSAKALLLDITRIGDRLVAVGDRGHVIVSADEGATWTQCITPTRAMLTGVAFGDEDHGWAVGHDGVIIATADGGKTWSRQDDGKSLDTVYLDVFFYDAKNGFVVGAYGKLLVTRDGGLSWHEKRASEEDVHFNRITADGDGHLYLAGEAGTILLSRDRGATWKRAEVPYEGSLYGVRPLSSGALVAYGLRGHIFVSTDDGDTWEERENETKVLIMAGERVREGVVVLAGQGGNFFISRDSGRTFTHWKPDDFGTSIADLAVAKDGSIVTVGEAGAVKIKLP
jgi:photosystem II stability/assembly factor-like uncharacterized protein